MQTDALLAPGYRACLLSRAADRSALGCKYVMPSEREKMLAGDLYNPGDPELVGARERARDLCQHARGSAGGARVDLDRASWFGRRHRVDAAAVLLRLRYKHTSWNARFLQLQLHRTRRVRGENRRPHTPRFGRPGLDAATSNYCTAAASARIRQTDRDRSGRLGGRRCAYPCRRSRWLALRDWCRERRNTTFQRTSLQRVTHVV
jgi:Maltose acetyltransferase